VWRRENARRLGECTWELLGQLLTADQLKKMSNAKRSAERVDFAIKLPGGRKRSAGLAADRREISNGRYQRLLAAQDRGDADSIEARCADFETQLKKARRTFVRNTSTRAHDRISRLMFLPTEGLYAERSGEWAGGTGAARLPGGFAGPTTLAALLNSLQRDSGRSAIQKSSSEVWSLLAG